MIRPRIDRSTVTCVVADDHPPIIDAATRYLTAAGFVVVATAHTGEQALEAVERHAPSVCIADVQMPHVGGLELVRRLARTAPKTAVLLYSGFSDRALVTDALDAGARGFALKDGPLDDLGRAVDLVAAGKVYIDPVLAGALAGAGGSEPKAPLSPREREVLRLLAAGGSYGEIGSKLFLSPDTVRAHAHKAMTKLGARTRTEAVALALRNALIA
jgi:DNA-binding NarL/FixJ family response regulator